MCSKLTIKTRERRQWPTSTEVLVPLLSTYCLIIKSLIIKTLSSLTYFTPCSSIYFAKFEHALAGREIIRIKTDTVLTSVHLSCTAENSKTML